MSAFFGDTIAPSDELPSGDSFELLPDGRYRAVCTDVEMNEKQTAKGDIREANFTFEIVEPKEKAGRKVWSRWPVTHWSEKAESFGKKMIGDFAAALGITEGIKDATPLMNKPVVIRVGHDPERTAMVNGEERTYRARNKVVAFLAPDEALESTPKPAPKKPVVKKPVPAAEPVMADADAGDDDGKMPWD